MYGLGKHEGRRVDLVLVSPQPELQEGRRFVGERRKPWPRRPADRGRGTPPGRPVDLPATDPAAQRGERRQRRDPVLKPRIVRTANPYPYTTQPERRCR